MKRMYIFFIMIIPFVLLSVGCSNKHTDAPSISVNPDSEYVKTFEDLRLGVLFDFDFHLPNADKRWVNLWVEKYTDGKKDSQPIAQLSYGKSPKEVKEGPLGFGMINEISEDTLIFLYGPGVSSQPTKIDKEPMENMISGWEYAIGEEDVQLKLGETKLLAAYRETDSNSISTVDLLDEEAVNSMIKHDDYVLLLKIKVEEMEDNE